MADRKTILVVEYDFEPGGAEWVLANLCDEMAANGTRVVVLTNRPTALTRRLEGRVQLALAPEGSAGVALLGSRLKSLIRHLRQERYDVVFSTERMTSVLLWLARMLSQSRAKLVIREAATNYSESFQTLPGLKRRAFRALFDFAYRRADLLIANSPGTRRSLERNKLVGRRASLVTLHNPVDIGLIQSRAREESAPLPGEVRWTGARVVAIGRLNAQKRMGDIIMAVALLRKAGMPVSLMVLGEGEERAKLENLITSEGLESAVTLAGKVENPYRILKRADVFVLASGFEGFGMVVVEALALGVPVVASDVDGGPRGILDEGRYGKLFPVGDIPKMAEQIRHCIECRPDPQPLIDRAWEFDKRPRSREYMQQMGLLPPGEGQTA